MLAAADRASPFQRRAKEISRMDFLHEKLLRLSVVANLNYIQIYFQNSGKGGGCSSLGRVHVVLWENSGRSLIPKLSLQKFAPLGIFKHSFLLGCRSYSITLQKLLKDNCNKESTVGANCVPTQQNTGRSLPSRAGNPILFDLLTLTF